MIELCAASDDDVVLAFLRAEIDSPKWGSAYGRAMRIRGLTRESLLDAADLSDAKANVDRMNLLADVRGFGRGTGLFQGFPPHVEWRLSVIETPDFGRLKYISKDEDWRTLSGGTRLVEAGARNLESDVNIARRVRETRLKIEHGECTTALVIVEKGDADLVIVEGHTRATAYAVLSDRSFTAFIGRSPLMHRWAFV
jgi:hypothetical protein